MACLLGQADCGVRIHTVRTELGFSISSTACKCARAAKALIKPPGAHCDPQWVSAHTQRVSRSQYSHSTEGTWLPKDKGPHLLAIESNDAAMNKSTQDQPSLLLKPDTCTDISTLCRRPHTTYRRVRLAHPWRPVLQDPSPSHEVRHLPH